MTSHFFSSQFFALCGAPQLLFSLYAPSEALLSLFFSIFRSLRGISASFPSPCPVRSSSFSFLLNFSLSAGHLGFFSFSMPRSKLFFPFSSQFLTLCGASQLLFSLHAPSEALLSLFFSIFRSLRGISASFPSPCPVRFSSFPFLLNFSLSAGHHSFFSFPMPRPMHWFSDYKAAMPAGSAHTQPTSKNSYLLHRPQSPSHWLSGDSLP